MNDNKLNPSSDGRAAAAVRKLDGSTALKAALEETELRLKTFLANTDDILYEVRGVPFAGTFTFVSEKVTEITGYRPADFIRDRSLWFSLLHPDDLATVQHSTSRLITEKVPVTRQYRLRTKTSRYRWLEDRVTPQIGTDGTLIGITGVVRDISDRRDLEAQLLQSQKMDALGRLAGGVAHDFNNFLTIIKGFSSLLLQTEPPDSPAAGNAKHIQNAADRAANLTRRLLAFTRQKAIQLGPVDIHAKIQNFHELLVRVIPANIEFSVTTTARQPYVFADDSYLEQILINLIVNACDAMPTGGSITLETITVILTPSDLQILPELRPGPYTLLRVIDTGHGIDEETLPRIFEPFFTTKHPGMGSGLGLSIVFGLVRQIGGCIRMTSQVGHGATATLYLPECDRVIVPHPAMQTAIRRGCERVLVVDAETEVAGLIQAVLENHGYIVFTVRSPREAVELARTQSEGFALLITNVAMPEMSGPQLVENILREGSNIRVLFMSGHAPDTLVETSLAPSAFLAKPFAAEQLLDSVRTILDRA